MQCVTLHAKATDITPRLYLDTALQPGAVLPLPPKAEHHLKRVLKMRTGETLEVFDGCGHSASATLQQGKVLLDGQVVTTPKPPCMFWLGQAISNRERMEYAVQKSVELGVAGITPLLTEHAHWSLHGERQQRRIDHWQRIAISACEQSGQNHLPRLALPCTLSEWVEHVGADCRVVLQPGASELPELQTPPSSVSLAVGPVGGWSKEELEYLLDSGFTALGLGPRVLRTETAPVAALAVLQWHWGDLANRG